MGEKDLLGAPFTSYTENWTKFTWNRWRFAVKSWPSIPIANWKLVMSTAEVGSSSKDSWEEISILLSTLMRDWKKMTDSATIITKESMPPKRVSTLYDDLILRVGEADSISVLCITFLSDSLIPIRYDIVLGLLFLIISYKEWTNDLLSLNRVNSSTL